MRPSVWKAASRSGGTACRVMRSVCAVAAVVLGLGAESRAQVYRPILDSSESQTPQGVRGADGSEVVLACSYTPVGGLPQGMWWKGSLVTGSGVTYQVSPVIGSQTVTSALYYGPDTPEFDPTLGAGDVRIVGSYQYVGSTQDNNGVLYTGPISGTGGTWTQINVPDSAVSGTVANTIPHSVMGRIVVGNYNLVVGGTSAALGNAFLYNIVSGSWTIFDAAFGGTDKLTSAYGIWQNGIGSTSYTIAGGSKDAGLDKAFLIDYDSSSGAFSNLTYFHDGAPGGLSHFEGITGAAGGYNVIGIAGTGYAFASIARNPDNSFGPARWTGPLSYPGSAMTTGNTVIGDQAIGIYTLSSGSTVYAYVATVPEPSTCAIALAGLACCGFSFWGRRRRGLTLGLRGATDASQGDPRRGPETLAPRPTRSVDQRQSNVGFVIAGKSFHQDCETISHCWRSRDAWRGKASHERGGFRHEQPIGVRVRDLHSFRSSVWLQDGRSMLSPGASIMVSVRLLAMAIVSLFLLSPGRSLAITVGSTDTFTGSLDNWQKGQVSPTFLSVVASGGPAGAGDSYLQSVADGSGSFGRLTVFNQNQWDSNYVADGVTSIRMDLLNSGTGALQIRLGLRNAIGAGFISTTPFALGVGGGWQTAEFPVTAAALTTVGAPGSFSTFLSGAFALRILHATTTSNLNGSTVVGTLGIDNITAVPEPSSTLLALAGLVGGGWAMRRRRSRS